MIAPTDQQVEQVASMMFAAALTYTNTFGRKGWAWEACDEASQNYWRPLAKLAWDVFNNSEPARSTTAP